VNALVKLWAPGDRCWAVGSNPARLAHRVVGEWPGNDAVQTACGASICLHADGYPTAWPFPLGGLSLDFDDIPPRYRICLKCVAADETLL
jgi:hypothetical protein